MALSSRLRAAYRRARYEVVIEGARVVLRIGRRCRALDAALALRGARYYAIVTSDNPHSRRLAPSVNASRRQRLVRRAARLRLPTFASHHRDPRGRWPEEHGLLLLRATPVLTLALARAFGQCALVEGGRARVPRLRATGCCRGAARKRLSPIGLRARTR